MKTLTGTLTSTRYLSTVMGLFALVAFFVFVGAGQAYSACAPTTWDLIAGQTHVAGSLTVENDLSNLYVTYSLTFPGATFGTLHLWVGNDLASLPKNNQGVPVQGKFPYQYDATGLTSYTFTIPLNTINVSIPAPAQCSSVPPLQVVAHAEVSMDTDNDGVLDHETAYGGDTPGEGSSRWWFYGTYTFCCDLSTPPGLCFTQTAFAKGTHVFVVDRKANPENLPSLSLTKNRWGWAINLTAVTAKSYDIYAGAGLNKIANGVKVGSLTINWNGSVASVQYQLNSGYFLEEVHIYASDVKPTTIAPGQYGLPEGGYDVGGIQNFYLNNIQLSDFDGDGVWIIAHAVVSNGQCD